MIVDLALSPPANSVHGPLWRAASIAVVSCVMATTPTVAQEASSVLKRTPSPAKSTDAFSLDMETKGDDQMVHVRRGGTLWTTLHSNLLGTPALYPVHSPSGLSLTRDFPMKPAGVTEKDDHDHHRSMWFTHGIVNGQDFWIDDEKPGIGRIQQVSLDMAATPDKVTITTGNDWISDSGQRVMTDRRVWTFFPLGDDRVIDLQIRLTAQDADVTLGDTKEGTFGIRVAGSMKVDAGFGGRITNAEGVTDAKTWGQISNWVDYSGPVADDPAGDRADWPVKRWPVAGVTMMAHPSNEAGPCRWHVRTYGLFAANPFGRHDFGAPAYDGVRVTMGDSISLAFRTVLHDGPLDVARTADLYAQYAGSPLQSP